MRTVGHRVSRTAFRRRWSGSLLVLGASVPLLSACVGPSIARERGIVVSIDTPIGRTSKLCLANTVDAGSTYGDRKGHRNVCWDGQLEGIVPHIGDCVVMQAGLNGRWYSIGSSNAPIVITAG